MDPFGGLLGPQPTGNPYTFANASKPVWQSTRLAHPKAPGPAMSAPPTSLGGMLQNKVAGAVAPVTGQRFANNLAGLLDYTPVGAVTQGFQAGRDLDQSNWLAGGLGAGSALLSAIPVGGPEEGAAAKGIRSWLGKKPFFHGTPDPTLDISSIDLDKTRTGNYGRGLYVSARPDIASGYAGHTGAVYPLQLADNARILDLTTPEGREAYSRMGEDQIRSQYDVIRAPGESVILNSGAVKSAFDRGAK